MYTHHSKFVVNQQQQQQKKMKKRSTSKPPGILLIMNHYSLTNQLKTEFMQSINFNPFDFM